ncbi:MAG: tetratricopeptide repeat protein [Bacteroidota bacterium]
MSTAISISKTKIIPPRRRPELLSRPRLLEALNASLDRKLILVSAPAGYGKTSLLVDLADHTKLPVCWLSLDLLDRDPQHFISYLVAALGERFPGIAAPLQPLLRNLKSIEADADGLVIALTNELYEHVEEDFILVLDDFHLLDGVPAISLLLNRFIQLCDDNCHVVLATRTLPDLPDLTLMVAREQTEGMGQTELAFQPHEIQALFVQNQREHLSEQTALQLFEETNGWITGLILSKTSEGPHVSGVDTFAYLGRQVLDQQPGALRQFLLRTSVPDEFNQELCEAVLAPFQSERQDWPALILRIIEKNLFALRVGPDAASIRYHPLFREFLQARLAAECPGEISEILGRLTRFYQKTGEWEKAYFTCQQLHDPQLLASLVEQAGTPMLQHAFTTLEGWVNSLPPGLTGSRPGLISLRGGIAIIRGDLREAIQLLNAAEAAYRSANDIEGLALALTRRASAYRQLGQYELAIRHSDEVMALTQELPAAQAAYAEALRIKGASLYRLGHSREAIQYLEHSLSLFRTLRESGSIPLLLVEVGTAYSATGDMEGAAAAYQGALKIWQVENNLPRQADVMNNIGMLHQKAGEYERAVAALDHGLALAHKSRYSRVEAVILLGLGDIYAEVGDYVSAGQAYEKAAPLAAQWPGAFIDTYLILARANLAVLQGEPSLARSVLQKRSETLQANSSLYERGLRALIEGRIALLEDQARRAVSAFQEARQCFTGDGRSLEICWSQIWLVAALGQLGELDLANKELLEMQGLWSRPAHAVLIMVAQALPWLGPLQRDPGLGRGLRGLVEKARRLEAKLPAVRRSLRRLAQSIEMPGASLVIRAFGRGEVQVDGRTVTSSEWSAQSVHDLFFYFLYKGGAVTKEQIAAALWPEDQDPQILKQRFKAYIFRLRRATRRDVIIFDEEYYRFNYTLDYEYDVEAFETFLARARATRDPAEQMAHFQKALSLVRGPYLSDLDMPWTLGERERLEQIYLAALTELSRLQLASGKPDEALRTARQIPAVDPYREEAYRLLMRIHAALGDRLSVHRQYQACKSSLALLGLSPSAETEQLHLDLTK